MRPVNLMPPEDRRGGRAPMRTGAVSYVLIAALTLGLLGVIVTALTSKQISDREAEVQTLEGELAVATARADSLRSFADFRAMQETRTATVASLAQSRFDWDRVMNELALVIPSDVWLVNLTGTVNPAVEVGDGGDIPLRDTVAGPALELIGCAPSQDSVAGLIAALEDIDGVTRVGVGSSKLPEEEGEATPPPTDPTQATDDCRTRDFIARFEIVVAFDAVPVPPTASAAPAVPAPLSPDQSQLADAQAQQAASRSSGTEQAGEAQQATDNLLPGG